MVEYLKNKVSISSLPVDPENPDWGMTEETVYSTRISHDKEGRSPKDIWNEEKNRMSKNEMSRSHRDFLDKLSDWGHVSAFYQSNAGLLYEIPRHMTMFLCSFDHPKYLQQSQRYTKANYFIEDNEDLRELIPKSSDLYNKMVEGGIKKEDARFILPLSTSATHLHQSLNFTGLANIYRVLESDYSKVPSMTREAVDEALSNLNSKEPDLFRKDLIDSYNLNKKGYPVANMFSEPNKWINDVIPKDDSVVKFSRKIDEELVLESKNFNDQALSFMNITNKKDEIEGYSCQMSLASWHQFMRNDTVKQSTESIYDAAERGHIVLPETIEGTKYENEYLDLSNEMLDLYKSKKTKHGEADSSSTLPHALSLGVGFDFDAFNSLVGFMKDRTSKAAQWEIRRIAKDVKGLIEEENPVYSNYIY